MVKLPVTGGGGGKELPLPPQETASRAVAAKTRINASETTVVRDIRRRVIVPFPRQESPVFCPSVFSCASPRNGLRPEAGFSRYLVGWRPGLRRFRPGERLFPKRKQARTDPLPRRHPGVGTRMGRKGFSPRWTVRWMRAVQSSLRDLGNSCLRFATQEGSAKSAERSWAIFSRPFGAAQ